MMKMVKARCRIIAKKAGTTFVRAEYDGKTYRCKVTVVKRPSAPEEITFNGQEYTLAFADEFNSLDMSNWAYCPEMERQDAGGVWRRSCSGVKDGNLVITCDIADDGTPVSGGIRSVKEHERTYGLYHIRFKAEKADGLWYAFWLLNDNMEEPVDGYGPCAVPCDLIISAEYGKWGGDIDKTQLPAHFYVDHVRIYEKAGE